MRLARFMLLLAWLPAVTAWSAPAPCVKKVRWFDDAPFSYSDANGRVTGFTVEVTRDVLRRMHCRAEFVRMPFARGLIELELGRLDILPGAFRTVDRERFAMFSKPIAQSANVLYVRADSKDAQTLRSLADLNGRNFRLGVQVGVSYGPQFDALLDDENFRRNLVPLSSRQKAWVMLSLGRLDGLIADEATALLERRQENLEQQVVATNVIVSTNTALAAFSKHTTSPQFVTQFNAALAAAFADGTYRKLRDQFLPCPANAHSLGCSPDPRTQPKTEPNRVGASRRGGGNGPGEQPGFKSMRAAPGP